MQRRIRDKVDDAIYLYFKKQTDNDLSEKQIKWGMAIDSALKFYENTQKYNLIFNRYALQRSEVQLCMSFHIEKTTLYNWVNEIIATTLLFAAMNGLVQYDVKSNQFEVL